MATTPKRGELWACDFDARRIRPVLVVSVDEFNESGAGQVLVVPLTSRDPKTPFGVPVSPPLGGLTVESIGEEAATVRAADPWTRPPPSSPSPPLLRPSAATRAASRSTASLPSTT